MLWHERYAWLLIETLGVAPHDCANPCLLLSAALQARVRVRVRVGVNSVVCLVGGTE